MEELMINLLVALGINYTLVAGSILFLGLVIYKTEIVDQDASPKKIDFALIGKLCIISLCWPWFILWMIIQDKNKTRGNFLIKSPQRTRK
jgi:hypothetical protein